MTVFVLFLGHPHTLLSPVYTLYDNCIHTFPQPPYTARKSFYTFLVPFYTLNNDGSSLDLSQVLSAALQKTCPKHSTDGTPECCSCNRAQPRGVEYAQLADGRHSCLVRYVRIR